ncbi:unnamed protein product [Somion occarium]|uniref:Uncharacterized protein n=1 Tax=Somion occarium TaxID=3059160 RepID=A0ABP1DBA6_9APHY
MAYPSLPAPQSYYSQQYKPGQSSKTTLLMSNPYNQQPSYPAFFNSNAEYAQSWWLSQNSFAPSYYPEPANNDRNIGALPPFYQEGSLTLPSLPETFAIASDVPPSPTDVSSNASESGPSPGPDFVHAVCNAPLVAPVPLPYHSPTFLQFDLPDDDEDLSHPPYVSRPHKRKRESDEADDLSRVIIKRQATPSSWIRRRSNWAAPQPSTTSQSQLRGWAVPAGFGGYPFPG